MDLMSNEREKVLNIPNVGKFCNIDVQTVGPRECVVLHLETKRVFVSKGEVIFEVLSGGVGCFTLDCFLMLKVIPDGFVEFFRVDTAWDKQPVKAVSGPILKT